MNSRELREKGLKIAHEARDLLKGEMTPETEAKFDAMLAESDKLEARAAQLEALEARERAYNEADARRPIVDAEARSAKTVAEKATEMFSAYLRGEIGDRELRAQSAGTASEGGYLVPTTLQNKIISGMALYGPLNDGGPATYLRTATGNPMTMPTNDDTSNTGALIAENTAAADGDLAFGQTTLSAYLYTSKVVKVSNTLLQDAAFDVEAIVAEKLAERLGRIANTHLTTGDGSSKPTGVVTSATVGVTGASKTAFSTDMFIDLEHSVDPAYRAAGAGFMFNDNTLSLIRKLKDSEGRPLWQPSYIAGVASTFNGRPYWINQDMASIGSSAKSVLFGDFSKYNVRQVRPFALRRLDERYAEADQVGFVAFIRLDGKLLDAKAIKVLQHAA